MDDLTPQAKEAADALRAVADFVETHPHFALAVRNTSFVLIADAEELPTLVRWLGGHRSKTESSDAWYRVIRDFGCHVRIQICAPREEVCTTRVVGREKVEIPDPDAPKITVERDVIEWVCDPVLS